MAQQHSPDQPERTGSQSQAPHDASKDQEAKKSADVDPTIVDLVKNEDANTGSNRYKFGMIDPANPGVTHPGELKSNVKLNFDDKKTRQEMWKRFAPKK